MGLMKAVTKWGRRRMIVTRRRNRMRRISHNRSMSSHHLCSEGKRRKGENDGDLVALGIQKTLYHDHASS